MACPRWLTEAGWISPRQTNVTLLNCQRTRAYRGAEDTINFVPKIKIEVVLADGMVAPAIEAIVQGAKTDQIGDGKVFVSAIENAIRIRTRESGEHAV
ncbi:MAG: P-II family nitrogen regulator [Limisphaerales bacterium]